MDTVIYVRLVDIYLKYLSNLYQINTTMEEKENLLNELIKRKYNYKQAEEYIKGYCDGKISNQANEVGMVRKRSNNTGKINVIYIILIVMFIIIVGLIISNILIK
jgi:hypothetical protein